MKTILSLVIIALVGLIAGSLILKFDLANQKSVDAEIATNESVNVENVDEFNSDKIEKVISSEPKPKNDKNQYSRKQNDSSPVETARSSQEIDVIIEESHLNDFSNHAFGEDYFLEKENSEKDNQGLSYDDILEVMSLYEQIIFDFK